MKIATAICFSLVTAVSGALLPISSSNADPATTDNQTCDPAVQTQTPDGPYTCGERDHKPVDDRKHDDKDQKK